MTMGCSFGNDHTVPWIQSSLNRCPMYYGALVQCQSESKLEASSHVRDHERDLREPSVRNGIMFEGSQLLVSLRGSNKKWDILVQLKETNSPHQHWLGNLSKALI